MIDRQPTLEELKTNFEIAKIAADAAEKALLAAEKVEKNKKLEEVLDAIRAWSFTQDEVCGGMGWKIDQSMSSGSSRKIYRKSSVAPPKYRNPANEDVTWNGRGKNVPEWAKDYLLTEPGEKPRKFRNEEEILNPDRLKYDQEKAQKK